MNVQEGLEQLALPVLISVGGGLLGIAFGFFLAWLIARTAEWKAWNERGVAASTTVSPLDRVSFTGARWPTGILTDIVPVGLTKYTQIA